MIHIMGFDNYLTIMAEDRLLRRLNRENIYRSDLNRKKYDEFLLMEMVLIKNRLVQAGAVFFAVSVLMVLLTKM